jgi:hypothetical protein
MASIMLEFRNGYGLARKIDGRYHLLTGSRRHCTQCFFMAMLEPVKRKLEELMANNDADGVVIVRVTNSQIDEIPYVPAIVLGPEESPSEMVLA